MDDNFICEFCGESFQDMPIDGLCPTCLGDIEYILEDDFLED